MRTCVAFKMSDTILFHNFNTLDYEFYKMQVNLNLKKKKMAQYNTTVHVYFHKKK